MRRLGYRGTTAITLVSFEAVGDFSFHCKCHGMRRRLLSVFTTPPVVPHSTPTSNYAQAKVTGHDGDQSVVIFSHGCGRAVRVGWQTAQECDNKGFNLYRADEPGGAVCEAQRRSDPERLGVG